MNWLSNLLSALGGIIIWNNALWIGFPIGIELFILAFEIDDLRTIKEKR